MLLQCLPALVMWLCANWPEFVDIVVSTNWALAKNLEEMMYLTAMFGKGCVIGLWAKEGWVSKYGGEKKLQLFLIGSEGNSFVNER